MSVLRVVVIGICITAMAAADFIVENPPGSGPPNSTTTATFHDIDDVCCAAVKAAMKAKDPNPPACFIGKDCTAVSTVNGGTCSGETCNLTSMMPPTKDFKINEVDWFGLSVDCCKFLQTHQPPVPTGCPPQKYCLHIDETFTKSMASAEWWSVVVAPMPFHVSAPIRPPYF